MKLEPRQGREPGARAGERPRGNGSPGWGAPRRDLEVRGGWELAGQEFCLIFPGEESQLSEGGLARTSTHSSYSFLCLCLCVFGHVMLRVTLWNRLFMKVVGLCLCLIFKLGASRFVFETAALEKRR